MNGLVFCVNKIKFLILVILPFLLACGGEKQECDYVPIVLDNRKGLVDVPSMRDKEHLDRVEKVLRYHRIEYQRIAPLKLRIHSKQWCLGNDISRDTLWNMTSKANDPVWMEAHTSGQ